ncbi:MAG: phosphoribosylformylglycinamidine cyclo-ligase [Proteobacteria bacterium]|nr:phosphoribosylformylglycinamidine cyclo-ligase [Pseudomonadota bacterium]
MPRHQGLTYRDSGVDIDAGNALVERIKPMAASTARPGASAGLGGFGAIFDPKAAGYSDPLFISTNDGVGTKLLVANAVGRHDTVGIDLVAMCVNDLIVQGAEPVFFLDYFASAKLSVDAAADVVSGIAAGCREAGCALAGGETAELPGLYAPGDYDLAGFAVGIVERDQLITGETIVAGDVLIGLASSGVHSNGYSLVRKIVEMVGLSYGDAAPFEPSRSLGDVLLTPTRIYVRSCLPAMQAGLIKGAAHITGGGLLENIPRVLPADLGAAINVANWQRPPVFSWLAQTGGVAEAEMLRTFNCGVGMVLVVAANQVEAVTTMLRTRGESVFVIGTVEPRRADAPVVRTL